MGAKGTEEWAGLGRMGVDGSLMGHGRRNELGKGGSGSGSDGGRRKDCADYTLMQESNFKRFVEVGRGA